MSTTDTIDAATVLRCIDIISHLPAADAPLIETEIIENAAAALLKLIPDQKDVRDHWSLTPFEPDRRMELAGQAALRHALGPAGMKLLLGSRPDIVRRVWTGMAAVAPVFGEPPQK